eukprot:TRINITY_DN24592_c0_g2_i3.p2 TRINITY_DN24592_c0_g2~~TRINITY_DN24592_c0_g2_i3.p2  ORF type:complete len:114 (-),score=11.79 TRINITY_DN24592_c0_g2_i3:54-371(-)
MAPQRLSAQMMILEAAAQRDVQALLGVVRTRASELNAVSVSTAAHRLARTSLTLCGRSRCTLGTGSVQHRVGLRRCSVLMSRQLAAAEASPREGVGARLRDFRRW